MSNRRRRRQTVPTSMLVDYSLGELSTGIAETGETARKQMATIAASKAALGLQDNQIKKLEAGVLESGDENFKKSITEQLEKERERLYILGYNSIGRDQSEYLVEQDNFLKNVGKLQEHLAMLDQDSEEYEKAKMSGRSQFIISSLTDEGALAFYNDMSLNNGNNIKATYDKDSGFTLSYNQSGLEEGLNGKFNYNLLNQQKIGELGGGRPIKYVSDQTEFLTGVYNQVAKKYKPELEKYTRRDDQGRLIVTNTAKYNNIRQSILEELKLNPAILNNVSVDVSRWLKGAGVGVNLPDAYNEEITDEQAEAMVIDQAEYITNLMMPGDDQTISTEITEPEETSSLADRLKQAKINLENAKTETEKARRLKILNELRKENKQYQGLADSLTKKAKQVNQQKNSGNRLEALAKALNQMNPEKPFNFDGSRIFVKKGGDTTEVFSALSVDDLSENDIKLILNAAAAKNLSIPANEIGSYLGEDVASLFESEPGPVQTLVKLVGEVITNDPKDTL